MAKPKQKQMHKKNCTSTSLDPPNYLDDDDDDWILVKKQKINVLIPPLPLTKHVVVSNPQQKINPQTIIPKKTQINPEPAVPSSSRPPPVQCTPNLLGGRGVKNQKFATSRFGLPGTANKKMKRTMNTVCSSSRLRNVGFMVNNSLRAMNVERKLRGAGGLRRWLMSLGLDQFVNIFEGKRVGKFQLVNLTMNKLKEMGVVAVGPRRKLIHAIECLCQPYCFQYHLNLTQS